MGESIPWVPCPVCAAVAYGADWFPTDEEPVVWVRAVPPPKKKAAAKKKEPKKVKPSVWDQFLPDGFR